MDAIEYDLVQALRRVKVFAGSHAGDFKPDGKASKAFTRLPLLLEEIGDPDLDPGIPASRATGAKTSLLEKLWEDLKAIAKTARTIARDDPGFDADFRLGEETQRGILASADAFLEKLEPQVVAKFTDYELPDDFASVLKRDFKAIHGLEDEQTEGRMEATGGTAEVRKLLAEGRALLRQLDTAVRNRYRHDPEILAAWRVAARIHRPSRPPGTEPARPSNPDGASGGTPGSPDPDAGAAPGGQIS